MFKTTIVLICLLFPLQAVGGQFEQRIRIAINMLKAKDSSPNVVLDIPVIEKAEEQPTEIHWLETYKEWDALAKSGEGAIVYLHNKPHCPNCILVERDVFKDSKVIEKMNTVNCLKVAGSDAHYWEVTQFPTILVVDSKWQVVGKHICPTTPDEFLKLLFPEED